MRPAHALRLMLAGSTLLVGVGLAGIGTQIGHAIRPAEIRLTTTPPCHEDQPCWDCTRMGNGICGLTPTENAAELLESTTHNGQELPATL